ncbi:MAG: response regulator [Pseudomonadota bacterium]
MAEHFLAAASAASRLRRRAMAQVKVLLVDDEQDFVQTLARRLRRRNFEVRTATDGRYALELIRQDVPDIVVVDLHMPGIDGTELIGRMKALYPDINVVVLTGEPWGQKVGDALRLGALGCLEKPLNFSLLTDLIKTAAVSGRAE